MLTAVEEDYLEDLPARFQRAIEEGSINPGRRFACPGLACLAPSVQNEKPKNLEMAWQGWQQVGKDRYSSLAFPDPSLWGKSFTGSLAQVGKTLTTKHAWHVYCFPSP